jgi:hypothetical protein
MTNVCHLVKCRVLRRPAHWTVFQPDPVRTLRGLQYWTLPVLASERLTRSGQERFTYLND